ncbi:MAG: sulfite exporter TauE/SafE family protein [Bacteroidales bacterium]
MEWYAILAIVGVGFAAGVINTLAAGGSLLTLPVLMAFGMSPNLANGTNRIAIFMQNLVGVGSFHRDKVMDFPSGFRVGIPAVVGSLVGAFIAVNLPDHIMKLAIAGVMVIVLLLMLLKPSRWIQAEQTTTGLAYWLQAVLFFLVGVYGGFIQAGVGFFLLTGLVLGSGFDLLKANALKVLVILLYTPVALVIFFVHGDVDLWMGLLLAAGNMVGAWVGARMAVKKGANFIRWVVMGAILVSAVKLVWDAIRAL